MEDCSGAVSLTLCGSYSADEPGFEQIEVGTTLLSPFNQLQLGDLTLGLAIGPGLDDGGGILGDAGSQ